MPPYIFFFTTFKNSNLLQLSQMYFCLVKVSCSPFNFLVATGWPFKGYIWCLSNLVWNQEKTTCEQSHLLLCLSRVIFLSCNNGKRYRKVSGHHSCSKPVSIPCSGKCSMEEGVQRRFWPVCTFSFFCLYSMSLKHKMKLIKVNNIVVWGTLTDVCHYSIWLFCPVLWHLT